MWHLLSCANFALRASGYIFYELMQKTSYKDLAQSKKKLEEALGQFGLKLDPGTWLNRAYKIMEELIDVYKDSNKKSEFMNRENLDGGVYYSLHDLSIIHDILPFIKSEDKKVLKRKLQNIMRIGLPSLESVDNNEARNTLWELNFLSRLKSSNIQSNLGDPNPDIFARFGSRRYYIQCKRIFSPKTEALKRNIINATKQLKNDLALENDDALGIMAFSFEHSLTGGTLMLVTNSVATGKEKLAAVLKDIVLKFSYLWQNPDLIQDHRIVAVVLHIIVPGIVEEEDMFVTGSQVIINNIWANGEGFDKVVADFGPLKEKLEH